MFLVYVFSDMGYPDVIWGTPMVLYNYTLWGWWALVGILLGGGFVVRVLYVSCPAWPGRVWLEQVGSTRRCRVSIRREVVGR
jgi:hypothetical protein